MGAYGSKIGPASIRALIRQLAEVYLPDDRNIVLDTLDQIDIRLLNKKTFAADAKEMKAAEAYYVMLKAVKKLSDDVEVITLFMQILESIKMEVPLVMDFIQYGGLDVVEKCMRNHSKDEYLAMTTPRILKVVLKVGAKASIEEINKESVNLQLCACCQEIIERQRHPLGHAAKIVVPKSADRISRVLRFMDNYTDLADVQIAGLDAVLRYARNADARGTARSTDVVLVVSKAAKQHKDKPAVVWRACSALALIAAYSSELAMDIAATMMHEELIGQFSGMTADPLVQVQILRLYAALLLWPKTHRVIHKSKACVEFVKTVVEEVSKAKKRKEEEMREQEMRALVAQKGPKNLKAKVLIAPTPVIVEQQVPAVAVVVEQQNIPMPVQLVKFVRESGGKIFREKSASKIKQTTPGRQRKNFDERPKFGTVDDRVFVAGEGGLIRAAGENDDGNQERKAADWEAHLQYGETKQG